MIQQIKRNWPIIIFSIIFFIGVLVVCRTSTLVREEIKVANDAVAGDVTAAIKAIEKETRDYYENEKWKNRKSKWLWK